LKVIVECAIEATESDVGMSRGTRDVARMQRAFAEERYEEICGWQNTDYFCAVFPSAAMRTRLADKPDLLVKILYACAARMQFNHWHYAPGHCPPGTVPADRHFYYPPRLADIAEWSDQHHTGHVLAEVRYSIRSPAPLVMNGKVYPGKVDLRLFRQSGAPYSKKELTVALMYTEYVRLLHQSLSDHLARNAASSDSVRVCINAFGKDWYREHFGRPAHTATAAAHSPAVAAPTGPTAASVRARHAPPDTVLFRILCEQASRHGGTAALIEASQPNPDVTITYRALLAHAQAMQDAMVRDGVAPGDVVAILSQRALHQTVAIVVGIANGLIVNPLNPALSPQVLQGQIEHAQPAWLIVDGTADPAPLGLSSAVRCVSWRDVFADVAQHESAAVPSLPTSAANAPSAGVGDRGGLLIYTSGTTGASKGVPLRWANIEANVRYAIGALAFEPGLVTGSLLPRFHTFTLISDIFPALVLGGSTVLADSFNIANVKWTVDAFIRHGVRAYAAVPVIFEALCALNAWANAPAMRMGIAGAAPLKENTRAAYAKAFGHPIIPCYGLSETTCFAAISPPDAIHAGAVGKPAGIEIRVVDDAGQTVGAGVTGELVMRGPSVIKDGYFRDTQGQFAHAFTADGWFKTGDVGRIDADGYVFVTGRKKNMVIRGGEKVYLEDVDRCLADFLGVLDCASVVLCEPNEPDQALTFIVTSAGAASGSLLQIEEVVAHVRNALSVHHVPDRIYFVDRIPRTATGKSSIPELLALAKTMRTSQSTAGA
jgi:acyl-CoA synthetase (AMP-forming)/AMP-acid ligase II